MIRSGLQTSSVAYGAKGYQWHSAHAGTSLCIVSPIPSSALLITLSYPLWQVLLSCAALFALPTAIGDKNWQWRQWHAKGCSLDAAKGRHSQWWQRGIGDLQWQLGHKWHPTIYKRLLLPELDDHLGVFCSCCMAWDV